MRASAPTIVLVAALASGIGVGRSTAVSAAPAQGMLVPQPFPGASTSPQASSPPAPKPPAPAPAVKATSTAAATVTPAKPAPADGSLGVQIYPTAEFLDSFDAGSGQRYFLYGTNAPYLDIVTYYRTVLKNGGHELFKAPPMQQFDIGRFQEETMAYPPSVVVKDYTWNGSQGYLFVNGTVEKRFKTVIQIVPPVPGK